MPIAHLKGRRVSRASVIDKIPTSTRIVVREDVMEQACLLYLHPLIAEVLRFFVFPLFRELHPRDVAINTTIWWYPLQGERSSILGKVEREYEYNRNIIVRIGWHTRIMYDTREYETLFFLQFPAVRTNPRSLIFSATTKI